MTIFPKQPLVTDLLVDTSGSARFVDEVEVSGLADSGVSVVLSVVGVWHAVTINEGKLPSY